MERILELDKYEWSEADDVPGQMRFVLPQAGSLALASVKLYLRDGYSVPEEAEEETVDLGTAAYREMLERSLMQTGNPARLQKAIGRARQGEDVTVAFIGGSITQGRGRFPSTRNVMPIKHLKTSAALRGEGQKRTFIM